MLVQKGLQIMETKKFTFRRSDVIIVGSGAAGLNAAIALKKQGIQDVTVLTEGLTFGTSRNTGSDKQTYYKLTSSGTTPDSVRQMAQTLFDGGCVDGDIALAEAAVSTRAFFHLVDIGVPFPCNRYGEYVGYKTDHDPFKRGISAGPLTSRYMTERLIEEARSWVSGSWKAIRLWRSSRHRTGNRKRQLVCWRWNTKSRNRPMRCSVPQM